MSGDSQMGEFCIVFEFHLGGSATTGATQSSLIFSPILRLWVVEQEDEVVSEPIKQSGLGDVPVWGLCANPGPAQ